MTPGSRVISCGFAHTAAMDAEGNVWTTGSNTYGQLGHGESCSVPTKIPNLFSVVEVACGRYFTICLDSSGDIWGFGSNGYGQLGLGDTNNRKKPEKIKNLSNVQTVAAGFNHTVCIDTSSRVWTFGCGDDGRLGLGHINDTFLPTEVTTGLPKALISHVACGEKHTMFLTQNGDVYFTGNTAHGQRGEISEKLTLEPVQCAAVRNIISICCGAFHTVFLNSDGLVMTSGRQSERYLDGVDYSFVSWDDLPPIQIISCGYYHSMFVDENGEVWMMGSNSEWQIGFDPIVSRTFGLTEPAKLNIPGLKPISFLSQGGQHSIIKEEQGEIYVFGDNFKGQLGTIIGKGDRCKILPTKLDNSLSSIIGERIRRGKSARK